MRHSYVGDDDVGLRGWTLDGEPEKIDELGAVSRLDDIASIAFECDAHERAKIVIVFSEEDSLVAHGRKQVQRSCACEALCS